MKFYHATTPECAEGIAADGLIKRGWDGCVYLCKAAADACKFLAIRGHKKAIVFEVELKEEEVQESFDHSEAFFRCKAYIHRNDIDFERVTNAWEYTFNL